MKRHRLNNGLPRPPAKPPRPIVPVDIASLFPTSRAAVTDKPEAVEVLVIAPTDPTACEQCSLVFEWKDAWRVRQVRNRRHDLIFCSPDCIDDWRASDAAYRLGYGA